jgi:hypothetical protein
MTRPSKKVRDSVNRLYNVTILHFLSALNRIKTSFESNILQNPSLSENLYAATELNTSLVNKFNSLLSVMNNWISTKFTKQYLISMIMQNP